MMVNPSGDESAGNTSLSLLARIKDREGSAWGRLAELYTPLVRRWCVGWGLQEADAADVMQEVLLSVSRNVHNFKREQTGGSFRSWLRTIAYHKACDIWKQRDALGDGGTGGSEALQRLHEIAATRNEPPMSEENDPEEASLLYRRAVALVLTDFEESTATAFWHVVVNGRAPADVAADLGLTTNAVYLAKARVLARLRQEFEGLIE
jgi:RNA polymerase sigma-70 factor (ECF subfamily)